MTRRNSAGSISHRGEDRHHRDVDPDVDVAELARRALGGGLHRVGVRDVGRDDERAPAEALDLGRRGAQGVLVAGEQGDGGAATAELAGRRAPDAGRRAGDDHDHAGACTRRPPSRTRTCRRARSRAGRPCAASSAPSRRARTRRRAPRRSRGRWCPPPSRSPRARAPGRRRTRASPRGRRSPRRRR